MENPEKMADTRNPRNFSIFYSPAALLSYYATLFHRRYKYYLLKSLVISITSLIVVNVIILAQCKQPYSTP